MISHILVFLMLMMISPVTFSQSICGSGFLSKSTSEVIGILDAFGFSGKTKRLQCGIGGEVFNVCSSCSELITDKMMDSVRPYLSIKKTRQAHFIWHELRALAGQIKEDGKDRKRCLTPSKCPRALSECEEPDDDDDDQPLLQSRLKSDLEKLGFKGAMTEFLRLHNQRDGAVAGEDFLYMHRQMLKAMNVELTFSGNACIAPWQKLPRSIDDQNWRMPDVPPKPHFSINRKEMQHYHDKILSLEKRLKDPTYLKSVSLNELGLCLQNELHGYLHLRYNDRVGSCKSADDVSPSCEDLMPTYSSHVNKRFWKIHGYIDGYIEAWLKANGKSAISENCKGVQECYQWQGNWTLENTSQ